MSCAIESHTMQPHPHLLSSPSRMGNIGHIGHIGVDASRLAVAARTGTERYGVELLRELARLDRWHAYSLYCNALPPALPPLGSNFSLCSLPFPRLWTHIRLSWEMYRTPPDLLFVPSHVVPLYHPRRPRCTVVTLHDLGYLAFPQAHTARRRLDLHLSTLWSARAASHIIAISQATKDDLVKHYRVPPEKITVVHHGVAPHFHQPIKCDIITATQQRYATGEHYLLYVGTIQPRKNLLRLIDAFAEVVKGTYSDAALAQHLTLVLAGKRGWLTQEIEQRAASHGIAERVRFIGYVADEDLPALLQGAHAFVFPSLYEGFGMPVLEAMAGGTPVLTSTTTSLPEVAGDAALLVDPQSSQAIATGITHLITDPALRQRLSDRGKQWAQRFTWQRCAEETHHVLMSALRAQ